MLGPYSFTVKAPGGVRLPVLVSSCSIKAGDVPLDDPSSPVAQFNAIWDTGATHSCITQRVVEELGLRPIGVTEVRGVHGVHKAETYLINILLPNTVVVTDVIATKFDLGHEGDVLIGMDVIGLGDFAVSCCEPHGTTFSFRLPSMRCTDYVKEDEELRRALSRQAGAPPKAANPPRRPNQPSRRERKKKR